MFRIPVLVLLLREGNMWWIILAFVVGALAGVLIVGYFAGKEMTEIDKDIKKYDGLV